MPQSLVAALCLVGATVLASETPAPVTIEALTLDPGTVQVPLLLPDGWQWGDPVLVLQEGTAWHSERVALDWGLAVIPDRAACTPERRSLLEAVSVSLGGGPAVWIEPADQDSVRVAEFVEGRLDRPPGLDSWLAGALEAVLRTRR